MVLKKVLFLLFIFSFSFENVYSQLLGEIRWCLINELEYSKCNELKKAIETRISLSNEKPPDYMGKFYDELPSLVCVRGTSQFDCMEKISNRKADVIQLETSISYTGGQYYTLMPLLAEKYEPGIGDEGINFYAVAIVNASKPFKNIYDLRGKKICSPGVGQAAGWVYPVSFLLENKIMEVAQCNVPVKSAANFFGDTCAPDGLARYYNTFGTNPVTICKMCKGYKEIFCTANDPYAGYSGAIDCLLEKEADVAFVRHSTLNQYIKSKGLNIQTNQFKLLCPDGKQAEVDEWDKCNWGKIPSHVVMTSTMRTKDVRDNFKDFLMLITYDFGANGSFKQLFSLFESQKYGKLNLMFSDETLTLKNLLDVAGGTRTTYYKWAVNPELTSTKQDLKSRLNVMNMCPLTQATWCVISHHEMLKCQKMIMAFAARNLKPNLNCIRGDSTMDCIKKIREGDADLITLDAADVYIAGKDYGLVPIAAEDYSGKNETGYYVVAVARKRTPFMLLTNLKQRRSCHAGVMTAAGWVVPLDMLIETGQVNVIFENPYLAVSQYFHKSCVPGVLDDYYNPHRTNPVSLCESCSTAGPRRCLRSDDELYFGSSGAFRCLVEMGGDVAFARHMVVPENTDGQNQAEWARNRRSDDYELLCKSGWRVEADQWEDCNLGWMPSNAVVTAGFKTAEQKDIYWTLLSYAQQFYDADNNQDFPMFDSMLNHKDLLFQDATVRLVKVENQNYEEYLGPTFVRLMKRTRQMDEVTGSSNSFQPKIFLISFILYFFQLF